MAKCLYYKMLLLLLRFDMLIRNGLKLRTVGYLVPKRRIYVKYVT
jgi:hypothetical protein